MKHLVKFLVIFTVLSWVNRGAAQTLKAVDNSQNVGKVEWLDRQINTGAVPFGKPVSREFRVKNKSSENLMILQVKSTCYCTVADWPQKPIEPGQTGIITVTYDGQREGDFYRIVSVSTNFDSAQTVPLALVGKVEKKQSASSGN